MLIASLSFCLLCLPVPIIPSYLYSLDESTDLLKNNTLHQNSPPETFHSIVSLYDNTVRALASNTTARSTDMVSTTPNAAELRPNSTNCPHSPSVLVNENVKVGMLFASKATVQLITNPFIGPLTNRWVFFCGFSLEVITMPSLTKRGNQQAKG